MERLSFSTLTGLLGLVVLSSLLLLPFGLNAEKSPFGFLHFPTVAAQMPFTVAVFLPKVCRHCLTTLTQMQRLLLTTLFIYAAAVSYLSPIAAAFVVLVTMLVHSLVSGVLFYPYSIVIGIIAFASLERIGRRERKS